VLIKKFKQIGVISPGTGPSLIDVSPFGFMLWLFIMVVFFLSYKIITGHWPFGRNESGIAGFIGVVGGYLLAWIIYGLVGKKNESNLEE
jgi:hypothetical protein